MLGADPVPTRTSTSTDDANVSRFTGLAVDVVTLNFCSRWMDEPSRRGCRDGLISGGLRPLPSPLPGISFGAFAMLHSVGVTATRHRVEKSSRWAGCDRKQLMFML